MGGLGVNVGVRGAGVGELQSIRKRRIRIKDKWTFFNLNLTIQSKCLEAFLCENWAYGALE